MAAPGRTVPGGTDHRGGGDRVCRRHPDWCAQPREVEGKRWGGGARWAGEVGVGERGAGAVGEVGGDEGTRGKALHGRVGESFPAQAARAVSFERVAKAKSYPVMRKLRGDIRPLRGHWSKRRSGEGGQMESFRAAGGSGVVYPVIGFRGPCPGDAMSTDLWFVSTLARALPALGE